MRLDPSGRPILASSSGLHCEACGVVFAAGHLPRDEVLICRECRDDQTTPTDPTLDLDQW